MNYTKIRIVFKDYSELYISEDEVDVFKLSGNYRFIEYRNAEDALHRLDGPAYEGEDGFKSWWRNRQRHRDGDLPAIISANGSKFWYVNGDRHRDGGLPAYEGADGSKEWYVNGKFVKKYNK